MLLKPYDKILRDIKSKESVEYDGEVEDNKDPLKIGRVRVRITLLEDLPTEDLPWCFATPPSFLGASINTIMFAVPEEGTQVKVYFPTKDVYHPFYKGANLTELNKCDIFDVDYPDSYGFKDSAGNFVHINKKTKEIKIQHSSSSNIYIGSSGTISHNHGNGNKVEIKGADIVQEAPLVKVEGNLKVKTGKSTVIPGLTGLAVYTDGILTDVL
jgi:hypothetical protein